MTGSESSGDGEIFDADAGRRQTHAHTVAAAAGAGRPASSRAAVDDSAGAAGVVEDDIAVEDDIQAGVTTTENPVEWRMQIEHQYRGSFEGLGNSLTGRYHVHLTPARNGADGATKENPLERQATTGKLVEIHGKISGDGHGWIDEELEIKSHFRTRGALMHRDNSIFIPSGSLNFDPSKVTELFKMIQANDFERTRAIVMENPNIINAQGKGEFAGMSPIHAAAHFGLDRIAALFLRQQVACHLIRNKAGREPLHEAVISGAVGVMKTLYDGGCYSTDAFDRFGFSALHYASMLAEAQKKGIIRFLVRLCGFGMETGIQNEAPTMSPQESELDVAGRATGQFSKNSMHTRTRLEEIRSRLNIGDTALHIAVKTGNEDAVKDLLDLGASVKATNDESKTPLHCVVLLAADNATHHTHHFQHIFKLLLSHGSIVDAVDNQENSVLHLGASANAAKVLAYLMLHTHVDIRGKNKEGMTPLLIAVQAGHVRCVDLIQGSHPQALDDVDSRGNSVLHHTAYLEDWSEIARVLLDFEGADAELKNMQGKTAKDIALEMGKPELAALLENYVLAEKKMAMQELISFERQHGSFSCKSQDNAPVGHKKLPPLRAGIHHIVRDDDMQGFVKQFAENDAGGSPHGRVPSPRSFSQVDTSTDPVTVVKEFLDRFASRENFDRFTRWKRKGHGLDPPLNKLTMGHEDMLTLLEKLGLMDHVVSRPEVYKIFWTKAPGQSKATCKEITFSAFRTHMRNFASNTPRELLLKFLSEPEVLQIDSLSVGSDPYSSDDDENMDGQADSMRRFRGELVDPSDYVPTVTGINCPTKNSALGSSRGGSRLISTAGSRSSEQSPASRGSVNTSGSLASRRSRVQSPDRLMDAFRDFSPTHKDKIRVDLDSGNLQQASWAPGTTFSKHKLRDLKETGGRWQTTPDNSTGLLSKSLRSSSRLGTGLSSGLSLCSNASSAQPAKHSLVWKPMGCSRSSKVMQLMTDRGQNAQHYKSISDLTYYMKPIWIEFSPAVAPMPQLLDAAHEATYSMCFEKGDYVGCFEVIQSSLNLTPVDEVDLHQRMYAQAVVFCNSYALRCMKARNLAAAASLLRKSEDMTAPSVAEYPGRKALLGWTMDTHAQYFYGRKKMNAALQYMQRAMDHIDRIKSAEGKATWRAHHAAILFACRRSPEAVEVIKDALAEIVGVADGVITKHHILEGRIPHAHRQLAASLCFNLGVCQAELNHHEHALTSCRFALLLCHGEGEGEGGHRRRMQRLHDALVDFLEVRNAAPTLGRSRRPLYLPPRSESTPPGVS